MIPVHKETNNRVKNHGSNLSQRRRSLPQPLPRRLPLRHMSEKVPHNKEQDEAGHADSGVEFSLGEGFESISEDEVRGLSRVDAGDSQANGQLG